MFGNLIESGSHTKDFKRRASFLFATSLFYAALLMAAGVGSIYAYNAHLEDQNLELVAMMRFPPSPAKAEIERPKDTKPASSMAANQRTTRIEISHITPYKPDKIASFDTKEVKAGTLVNIGIKNIDAPSTSVVIGPMSKDIAGNGYGERSVAVPDDVEPPPLVKATPTPQPPKPKTITVSTVLNGKAVDKPAPPYPQIAKAVRAQGTVAVQILVDEEGRVVSAHATSGHPLLRQAAVQAAYQARFTPTLLSQQPVKVSGFITYNFVLQ